VKRHPTHSGSSRLALWLVSLVFATVAVRVVVSVATGCCCCSGLIEYYHMLLLLMRRVVTVVRSSLSTIAA
jgi:hypothetical protein